jgi:hypothetical protein
LEAIGGHARDNPVQFDLHPHSVQPGGTCKRGFQR